MTFDNGAITFIAEMPLRHQVMGNGRSLPKVEVSNFDLHFDSSKIHISLSGGILADILDKIVWIFKSLVMGEISKVIDKQVPPQVEKVIND